ncbi:DUF2202 domain-containing protein [Halocola ammonii]
MKTSILKPAILLLISVALMSHTSCKKNDEVVNVQQNTPTTTLTQSEEDMLLFMLEEEKLARDTYIYFDNYWGLNQFANIKNSEQNHMELVAALLTSYGVDYEILPEGEFSNPNLQSLYDDFIIIGEESEVAALTVGATIEDLDIFDLRQSIESTNKADLIQVLEQLLCGSGNHMQGFTQGLTNFGSSYTPQYLTQEEYQEILDAPHGGCQ